MDNDTCIRPLTSNSRLVNLSTRGHVGLVEDILISGFTIIGSSLLAVLIRGVGSTWNDFGVSDYVSAPQIELFTTSGISLLQNNRWGEQSSDQKNSDLVNQLVSVSAQIGAFPFVPNSTDGVLIAVLIPGSYTVHLSGANDTLSEAFVEVYELP